MIRLVAIARVLVFLTVALTATLFAQVNPYGNKAYPYGPGGDPRVRRYYREQAVAVVGPIARNFVETRGDEAVAAIFACSKPVAVKLAGFHNSGELGMLPRPRDLLLVIAQPRHGDDVAIYAIYHARELGDLDSFNAYLSSPLEYAMGLKPLAAGADEARARRLNQVAVAPPAQAHNLNHVAVAPSARARFTDDERLWMAIASAIVVIGGLLLWRRRARAAGSMIACVMIAQMTSV